MIEDSLLTTYSLLKQAPGFNVSVLGERALLEQDLTRYDALIFPHQTTLSASALANIRQYYENGGYLIQDLRFDAFSISGKPRGQWQNKLFGIGGISWCKDKHHFIYKNNPIWLPPQKTLYFDCAIMHPAENARILMPDKNEPVNGLLLRGIRTLTFGFMPHLIEDERQKEFWPWLYLDAVSDLLRDKGNGQ